ncbi:hypothetical protein ANN_13213 [Periplaneta americana]|uniref:Uncharacterized protein n=1 Tax=Periplaneta americana TaxID=6978 RepID=A0ABQ8TJ67_PERAM|nr:hypothetical protein ANN_13213 [Periplaneta americana]
MAGYVARMGESRNAYRVLVGRPKGKRPLGRPRRRWEDNIKMDLWEVGYDDRDWINLAHDRDQWEGLCEGGNEPPGSLKATRSLAPTHRDSLSHSANFTDSKEGPAQPALRKSRRLHAKSDYPPGCRDEGEGDCRKQRRHLLMSRNERMQRWVGGLTDDMTVTEERRWYHSQHKWQQMPLIGQCTQEPKKCKVRVQIGILLT